MTSENKQIEGERGSEQKGEAHGKPHQHSTTGLSGLCCFAVVLLLV